MSGAMREPQAGSPLIELVNISKRFGAGANQLVAVKGINMSLRKGEFVTLIGPSGSGKSTLFNMIAGLLPPDPDGAIVLDGREQRDGELLGKVSFMPQRDLLLPWRTVLDNAIVALEVEGMRKKDAREKARALFAEFGLMGFEGKYPHELSGGMRQRVALMRTFLFERDLILLDEPFGALDALTRSMMQRWLLDVWAHHQRTVLFITHDIDEAIFLGDKVAVMSTRPGSIKYSETIDLRRPRVAEVATTREFSDIKRRLLDVVEEESRKSFEGSGS